MRWTRADPSADLDRRALSISGIEVDRIPASLGG
jgi:hypothetical protein